MRRRLTCETIQTPSLARLFTTSQPHPFKATLLASEPSPFRLSTNKTDASTSDSRPPTFEDVYYSSYQPKRQWPPDMSKLSQKHQFRLERKYRRRAALKYARPKFMKGVTIAQWAVIGCEYLVSIWAAGTTVQVSGWETRVSHRCGANFRIEY